MSGVNSGQEPLIAVSFWDTFVAEGSRMVNSAVLQGLHQGFDQDHRVLAIHDSVFRDGIEQPMGADRYYQNLVAAGIPVTTLGRRYNDMSDVRPYSEEELEQAARHARVGHVMLSLEEHPLRLINELDPSETPPLMVFLHRTAPESSGALPDLHRALSTGRIAMCIVDSEAAGRVYQQAGVPESSLHVVNNGIDLEKFAPSDEKKQAVRGELGIPTDAPTVLYVARFSDEKDVPLFVESAKKYLDRQPDGHIIMAGAGLAPNNEQLAKLVQSHFGDDQELLNRLHMLGIRRDIDALHAAANVVALTSRTESYPLCLLEGLAAGSVPVSTDVGDARIMLEGRGIITPADSEAIAKAWQEAYARREELAITAEQRENLGEARMLRQYDRLIRSVARPAILR